MSEGGKITPISPGVIARVVQGAKYMITGVSPSSWFGPMQPTTPMAPAEVAGRRYDYPTGFNLNYTPRSYEGVSFQNLRELADNCDILRSVIETRKDQMEALDWSIRIRSTQADKATVATAEQEKRIEAITQFFQYPDRRNSWQQWLRQWLEDMFVIDAGCFYKRRNRKGDLWALEPIDGATVKVLLDDSGRMPLPPSPAYQQILKGIPAADYIGQVDGITEFTTDELIYMMRNPRTHKAYGYSQVEQVLLTVNIAIRRSLHQLEYYREGSQPDALLMAPEGWTSEQIRQMQTYLDGLLSGNLAQRRKLRVLPGMTYQETKSPTLKDEYDEWLARIVCYVFSVPPTPFIKQMNRATADNSHDAALEEGLAPLQKYVRNHLNRIIAVDFKSPDLTFDWVDDREQDPQTAATIRQGDVKSGIISIDEARETLGLDLMGGAYANPMPLTATGFVAVKSPEEQQAASDAAREAQTAALATHSARNGQQADEHGGPDAIKDESDSASGDAEKMIKALKKKPNRYLPTTGHRQ